MGSVVIAIESKAVRADRSASVKPEVTGMAKSVVCRQFHPAEAECFALRSLRSRIRIRANAACSRSLPRSVGDMVFVREPRGTAVRW
jgi:hypothetical protein